MLSLRSFKTSAIRGKYKRSRKRSQRSSLMEVLDQRLLLTASSSSTTPYWQTIMPNQLPDGGQLEKQDSPVILTIDDGLATNTFNNANTPVYDSRTLGNTIMIIPVELPDPSEVAIRPVDPDDSSDDDPPGRLPPLPPATNYSFGVTLSIGTLGATAGVDQGFTTDGHFGDTQLSFVIDAHNLPSGRYNLSGEVTFPDPDYDTPITGVVNLINRTENPSGGVWRSEFGSGWSLPGLDRLFIQSGTSLQPAGVALVTGDNQFTWFQDNGDGSFERAPGPYDFSNLTEPSDGNPLHTYALTDPDGTIRYFDANGMERSIVDRNLNVLDTFTYTDADGNSFAEDISTIQDDVGRTTTFSYGGSSPLVTSISDFAGRVTTLTQDSSARLTSIMAPDPDGSTGPEVGPLTQYGYTGDSNYLTSVIDPRGLLTTIAYDDMDDVYTVTSPSVDTSSDSGSNVIEIDSIPAYWSTLTFSDSDDDGDETRNVYGNVSVAERDDFSNVTSLTDAAGKTWNYGYDDDRGDDSTGLLKSVTPPGLPETTYEFNTDTGELELVTNSDGSTEAWSYIDAQVSAHSISPADGPYALLTTATADSNENINYVYQSNYVEDLPGTTTHYTFTSSSDQATDNPSLGIPSGLLKTVQDPDGNITEYQYNSQGLVSIVTSAVDTAEQTTTKYDYDTNDNLSAVIDGLGNETDYVYDNLNRLVKVTGPAPTSGASRPVTKYQYDADGNLIATIDPLGNVTRDIYDSLNHQTQVIQPVADPSTTPLVVNAPVAGASGLTVTLSPSDSDDWNSTSRSGAYSGSVKSSTVNGGSVTFTISNASLDSTKKYLVEVRWVPSSGTTYDSNAQWQVDGGASNSLLTTQTVDLNLAPQGSPDSANLMWLSLGAFSPYVVGSTHSLTVKLVDTDDNGLLTVDAVRLVEVGPVTQTGYDATGNATTVTDPKGNVTNYTYDNLNRVTQEIDPAPTSGASNPTTTYTYNAVGWLTSTKDPMSNTTSYFYDNLGRQIGEVQPGEPTGLLAQYYLPGGDVTSLPDFSTLTPDHTREDSNINVTSTASNFGGYSDLDNNFAVRWTGAIDITTSGTHDYDFQLDSEGGGAQLTIDGQTIIAVGSTDATVSLSGGWHSIQVEYFNTSGDSGVVLKYAASGGTLAPVLSSLLSPVWQTTYDAAGRELSTTDPLGNVTSYEYDTIGNQISSTDADGNITHYTYDGDGNKTSEKDPDENTTTWTYTPLNQMATETDALGNETYYEYDAAGNLIRKTDRDGQVIQYTYDALNRETAEIWEGLAPTEVKGRYVTYYGSSFDVHGPVHIPDDAIATDKVALLPGDKATSANVTNYSQGITGIMVDIAADLPKDSEGHFLISASDFTFKVGTSSNPSTWSSAPTPSSITVDPSDGVDDSDRVVISWADGSIKNEWLQVTVKANSDTQLSTPDVFYFGNLVGDVDGNLTVNSADATAIAGNSASGVPTNDPYDLNRDGTVNGTVSTDTGTDYAIAASNSGHSLTSFTSAPSGGLTTEYAYTYDADSRLLSDGGDDSFSYDNLGNATTIGQGSFTLTQAFNANSLRTSLTYLDDTDGFVNNYGYNALNQMTSISQDAALLDSDYYTSGSGEVASKLVNFTYNADGQFDSISRYAGSAVSSSALVATSNYGYNDAAQLTSLGYSNSNGTGTTFASYGFGYDAVNRLTSFTHAQDEDDNYTATYDNAGQLLTTHHETSAASTSDETYTYDANGNVLTANGATNTIDTNNEIAGDGTYSYQYDKEGNIIKRSTSSQDYTLYTYDFRNRLTSATHYWTDGSTYTITTDSYAYDSFDRLVHKVGAFEEGTGGLPDPEEDYPDSSYSYEESYVYDGNQIVVRYYTYTEGTEEETTPVHIADRYLWGPAVDMLLADDQQWVEPSSPDSDIYEAGQGTMWAVTDQQNTVQGYLEGSGSSVTLTDNGRFTALGNNVTGMVAGTLMGFTGRFVDPDTGLQWNGTRWYNPGIGRWMSQDPLQLTPGPNPYEYAYNSPMNYTDPNGLWGVPDGVLPGINAPSPTLASPFFKNAPIIIVITPDTPQSPLVDLGNLNDTPQLSSEPNKYIFQQAPAKPWWEPSYSPDGYQWGNPNGWQPYYPKNVEPPPKGIGGGMQKKGNFH